MKTLLLLSATLALLLTSVSPSFAGPTPPFAIPDGEWQGSLSAYYLWELSAGAASGVWTWSGDMGFVSAAGELNGEAGIKGSGSGETSGGMGIGTVNANVAIFGSSVTPEFQATSGVLEITATSGGFSANMSFPIDASQSKAVPIKLTMVTCSLVTGDFDDFMNQYAASVGGSLTDLSTIFAAVRIADLAPEAQSNYQEELTDLVNQANEFLNEVKTTQQMDDSKLEYLLTKAEALALSLRKNNDCGFTKDWSFALPIASLVAQLIDFAHDNPGYFTNFQVFMLTETAVRAGLIGAGAVNPDLDTEMRSNLDELIVSKLNDLETAGGNCQALLPLWVAANTVGGAGLTKAQALFGSYGC